MTPDQNNHGYGPPQYHGGYPPPPPQAGVPWRVVGVLFFVAIVFGFICVAAGVFVMRHLNRIETLEHNLSRAESAPAHSSRQEVPPAPAVQPQPAQPMQQQPNIYFMVGGSGGGYPAPVQYAAPNYYPPPPQSPPLYHSNVNLDPYGNQPIPNEYMLQRGPSQPDRQPYAAPQPAYGGVTIPYYRDGFVVPAGLVMDLREKFTANQFVEDWFKEEFRQNIAPRDGEGRKPGEPSVDEILKTLAQTNFADKNFERASRIYTELASRQVHLTKAELMQWAKAAELSGDIESALKIMDLIYKNYPDDLQVLKEMAALQVGNQRFAEAAEILEVEPVNREYRLVRGKTLTWAGKGREAVDLLRQLHTETPNDWELSVMLVELLLSEHQFEEALPLLDEMIQVRPDDDSLKRNKIDSLEALQRFAEAADMIEDILPRYEDDEKLWLKLAKDRVAADQFIASVPAFERYLEFQPDDFVIREELGDALMAANSFAAAAVQFGLVSDFKPEDLEIKAKYANALMAGRISPGQPMCTAIWPRQNRAIGKSPWAMWSACA